MTFEVELKARLTQPAVTESKAATLGIFEAELFKEDVYFRRKGETNSSPDERYRLRRESDQRGSKAIVTFKQRNNVEGMEVNEEVEFEVDNAHAFFRFTDRFGFEPFVVKRKRSRAYRVGRVKIEINQVDYAGYFAEIEVMTGEEANVPLAQAEIAQVMRQLDLTQTDLEPRRYIDLIQAAHPARYRFIDDNSLAWPFEEV